MSLLDDLAARIDPDRLTRRALEMLRIPSPTGHTREAAMYFAEVYQALGCEVAVMDGIPDAPPGSDAPSVAARWHGRGEGPTLQLDGHVDTVPLEHEPPQVRNGVLSGRGAVDMKGSLAAVMEMVYVLENEGIALPGDLLLTTHGLHEAPNGHGEGLRALIRAGHRGDAAVVVEGPSDELAIAGRGMAIYEIVIAGPETSTHENETPPGTPHPLVAAGELLVALERERARLRKDRRPYVGCETLFVGQVHGGDFYNRFPTTCQIQGTRRYFADHPFEEVAAELRAIAEEVARRTGTRIQVHFDRIRDGYRLDENAEIVRAFRRAYRRLVGKELPLGGFASVADASILTGEFGIPAVYCGARGTGAHADREEIPVAELVRQTSLLLGIVVEFFHLE